MVDTLWGIVICMGVTEEKSDLFTRSSFPLISSQLFSFVFAKLRKGRERMKERERELLLNQKVIALFDSLLSPIQKQHC